LTGPESRVIAIEDEEKMSNTLRLEIVTPDEVAYSADVEMVTLSAESGQLGILPQHVPLMTQLVPGEMIVRKDGSDHLLAVGEGLVEIRGDRVSVLTDMAIEADKIDEARVEEARQRAAARLREKLTSEEVASVNAALTRSLVQLRVKRRRRT
jgi:F-type H+-transporting ATPase subunit epsilon